ncbi:MAG: UbiX family flavin prenyltransferase [Crenarchaeota archaeon]|nr:UbiX family flavin prenyltransferase [Thermoproteota archaeon]
MIGPRRSELQRLALVISGASGVVIGLRLAQVLSEKGMEVHAVVTRNALEVANHECISGEWLLETLRRIAASVYLDSDWSSPLASSSFAVDACIAAPLSISSAAKLALGVQDSLALRALANCLRLRRPVVAIVRECPLGVAELRALLSLAKMGVRIVPAVVGFYARPQSISEVVDFIVGKALDALGIENSLYRRWGDPRTAQTPDPCQALFG